MTSDICPLSRRSFLGGVGAFVAWANMPAFARASGRDPRLLVVLLRGAMDGLAAVPPLADPDYAARRSHLLLPKQGAKAPLPLDGFFGLNAAMPRLHGLYTSRQAVIFHAAATPYRERSHFDGQNVLENGHARPNASHDGWVNRVAAALPSGERVRPTQALAISPTVPLILRGTAPVLSWTPPNLRGAAPDTVARLHDLYVHTDPELATVFAEGVGLDTVTAGMEGMAKDSLPKGARGSGEFLAAAAGAAQIVGRDDGPRLAVLDLEGWDTHFAQGSADGRLADRLGALDAALGLFADRLAPVWAETAILVVTEFGRTVAENGTDGTDHGTGTAAFLVGGAVKGGRVVADWPGLSPDSLYEGRDLLPTTDLRAVWKGVLRDHFGMDAAVLAERVFPGSLGVKPMDGLIG